MLAVHMLCIYLVQCILIMWCSKHIVGSAQKVHLLNMYCVDTTVFMSTYINYNSYE